MRIPIRPYRDGDPTGKERSLNNGIAGLQVSRRINLYAYFTGRNSTNDCSFSVQIIEPVRSAGYIDGTLEKMHLSMCFKS